ncbi:MAG: hypothetical protein OQL19_00985 [Gammaproteobacteria bacterium]|nr:hypothetical protein [Gammaproteobacteria bacterium]
MNNTTVPVKYLHYCPNWELQLISESSLEYQACLCEFSVEELLKRKVITTPLLDNLKILKNKVINNEDKSDISNYSFELKDTYLDIHIHKLIDKIVKGDFYDMPI